MLLFSLLLAAAPVSEPDPGGLTRIQPRAISSDNDTALWAVDDDPATAWIARPESASLAWTGAQRPNLRGLRVFIRSGCEGQARPKQVSFSDSVKVELQDVGDWQRVELPGQLFSRGFNFAVVSTFAGAARKDVCVSDLRVYYDGGDAIDGAEETLAFAGLKRSINERLVRATLAWVRLPRHLQEAELELPPKSELVIHRSGASRAVTTRALALAAELRGLSKAPVAGRLVWRGWQRASVRAVLDDDASVDSTLATPKWVSTPGDALLAREDFTLVPAAKTLPDPKQVAETLMAEADRPLACRAVCLPAYAASGTLAGTVRRDCERVCASDDVEGELRADLTPAAIFVKGHLDRPGEVLILSAPTARELLLYEDGRVVAIASSSGNLRHVEVRFLTWSADHSWVREVLQVDVEGSTVVWAQRFVDAKGQVALR